MHSEFLGVEQNAFQADRNLQSVGQRVVEKLYFLSLSVLGVFQLGHVIETITPHLYDVVQLSVAQISDDFGILSGVLVAVGVFAYNFDGNSVLQSWVLSSADHKRSNLRKFVIRLNQNFMGRRFDKLDSLRRRKELNFYDLNLS